MGQEHRELSSGRGFGPERDSRARGILAAMRSPRLLLLVAGLSTCLLGCGQKGPLVLPDAQHPHKKIGIGKPPASPAPAPTPAAPGETAAASAPQPH